MLTGFSTEKALAHASQLSFPRRTGGPGGKRARGILLAELQRLGYGVSQEGFPIQADPFLLLKTLLTLTLLILVGSYLISRSHPLLASALMLIPALAIISAGHLWNAWVSSGRLPFKPRRDPGVNLVASLPPEGEGKKEILLVAHYDSKSQSLPLVRRSLLLICLVLLCLIMSLLYFSAAQMGVSVFPPPSRKQMGFLSAVSALCVLMIYRNKTFDTSPGGLDDASGVGTLLALAEALKAQPPSRVKVRFLLSDAEEEGLVGAWSYVKSHAAELSSAKPYVLNLDSVGIGGRLRLKGKFGSELAGKILQLAKRRGIPLKYCFVLPGILMDHLPFAWSRLEAISLFCLSRKCLHLHTPKDQADLLEERGMREVGELLLALVRELDGA